MENKGKFFKKAAFAATLGAFCAFATLGCSKSENAAQPQGVPQKRPPVPVVAEAAKKADFPVALSVIGTVEPPRSTQVRSQIGGLITQVSFKEGDAVRAGQTLFTIDQRTIEGNIKQLEADLARQAAQKKASEAQLKALEAQIKTAEAQAKTAEAQARAAEANSKSAEANAGLADAQVKRYEGLASKEYVSKEQFDQVRTSSTAAQSSLSASKATIDAANSSAEASRSNAEALKAQAEAARASIEATSAAMEVTKASIGNAKVQLGYTSLTAPFSGVAGSVMAKAGDLVKANDTALVTINQVNPVLVRFTVPESDLPRVQKFRKEGSLKIRADLPGRGGEAREGKIVFLDNAVDRATGTITLKAEFGNEDGALWPGQFTTLVLDLFTLKDAVTVPSPAILTGQKGPYVFVIKEGVASVRPVKPGPSANNITVVDSGVSAGETVVTDGQLKLYPDAQTVLKPAVGSAAPQAAAQGGAK
ncbi:efflux RND transporter periplasmic adaptor subunit [bacterium]|nr:MAG: efflux RND transporter periplasmic adaptor subunit [bacterium]